MILLSLQNRHFKILLLILPQVHTLCLLLNIVAPVPEIVLWFNYFDNLAFNLTLSLLPGSILYSSFRSKLYPLQYACVQYGMVASVVSNSFETPWTVAHKAPLSVGFSRQEHWNALPFPLPGDLPNPGRNRLLLRFLHCRHSLPLSHQVSPLLTMCCHCCC